MCGAERRWGYWPGGQGSELQKWAVKDFLSFRISPGRIFTQELTDSQGWQARGRRPLHPLRTPVQEDPAAAAMVLVKAERRTVPSSATSAWIQPRMLSSACVATSSGQYPCHCPRGHTARFGKLVALGSFGEGFPHTLSPDTLRLLYTSNSNLDGCYGLKSVRMVKGEFGQIMEPRFD